MSELWIYPIKSLGGVRVSSAQVNEKGLSFDRRWMLVDETGTFMTQRTLPAMALLKVKMDSDSYQNGEWKIVNSQRSTYHTISITPTPLGKGMPVTIWNDSVIAFEVSPETSQWFSDALQTTCKLVYFPEENVRPVDPAYQVNNEHVSLADAYPFMIIGQSSLDHLNNKLQEPIPMNRFRPNFVFTGGEPNEEDSWRNFTIGNNRFVGVKPCARCVVPTIHQDTAEKGVEPSRTLATYRKKENKILFGQNLVAVDHQKINEGDIITIQTRS